MFKRPRLRLPQLIVNAGLAASVIFLVACSGETHENEKNTSINNAPEQSGLTAIETGTAAEIQAVWSTRELEETIISLDFVGGSEPILAAVYTGGGVQFFDLEGDRITDIVDLGLKTISSGQAVVLGDTPITFFPALGATSAIYMLAYAPALGEPNKLDFLTNLSAAGLCSGAPIDQSAIMQLAYWTEDAPQILVYGQVLQGAAGELTWQPSGKLRSENGPITACTAHAEIEIATETTGHTLARLDKHGERFLLAMTLGGDLKVMDQTGTLRKLMILDGISVKTPARPTAMAALSDAQFGNYPNGLVVVAGTVDTGSRIVLIEPADLFANPD